MRKKLLDYAERLTDRFPDNVIFLYKTAELHDKLGNIEQAVENYRQVISATIKTCRRSPE